MGARSEEGKRRRGYEVNTGTIYVHLEVEFSDFVLGI